MEEKKTVQYKRTLRGSVGAGVSALMGGSGRRYYILEHRDASKYHKAGESQKIIIDQIELGRDHDCQVRFDETFETVSRRHAAIIRDGERWKLVQLSTTNTTFLNGRAIDTEWYLQNGDEIQLAVGGPRLGFIVPEGNQSLVKSIKMTERLELFRKQALKPYKRAIAALALLLVVAVCGLGAWNYSLHLDVAEKGKQLALQYASIKDNKAKADSLETEILKNNKLIDGYEERIAELMKQAASAMSAAKRAQQAVGNVTGGTTDEKLRALYPSVYYVEVTLNNVVDEENRPVVYTGTAFLLEDGRLVTAHHMVDLWSDIEYYKDVFTDSIKIDWTSSATILNRIAHNGTPIEVTWKAYSPSGGEPIQYHYTSENIPFTVGASKAKRGLFPDPKKNGISWILDKKFFNNSSDWAFINTGKKGVIKADWNKASKLGAKTQIDILGYPNGRGAENANKPTPIYVQSTVARDGLDVNGTIMLSNHDTQGGNSGGPVLIKQNNEYRVIGILSGHTGEKCRVVPIDQIR